MKFAAIVLLALVSVTMASNITQAILDVGHLAEKVSYSHDCQTHDCVAKYHTGDCWGMSDYIACELKTRDVETKILQYPTEYASNHRSVKYKNSSGVWTRFPYRDFNINYLFRDTDNIKYGTEVGKTC